MPVTGYSSVTVSDEIIDRLKKEADASHRTVPKLIEFMLEEVFPRQAVELEEVNA
jgi:predicted transcriptional regulator